MKTKYNGEIVISPLVKIFMLPELVSHILIFYSWFVLVCGVVFRVVDLFN